VIAKFGLGRNPIRTMLLVVIGMGVLGALFTIREWWVLYALGIWATCRSSRWWRRPSRP
jgi:DHA3 family multidrug efflux protein-like MFS transporter